METLYAELLQQLITNVPELRWIDLDQGQLDWQERHYPIPAPCCLINFENTDWEDLAEGLQEGEVTLTLRVGFRIPENLNSLTPAQSRTNGLNRLSLLSKIHKHVHLFEGTGYNALVRVNTETEKREDDWMIVDLRYQCGLRDQAGMKEYDWHQVTQLLIGKDPFLP